MTPRVLSSRPPLVLAYHGIAAVPREADPTGLMCPLDAFKRHVEWLHGRDYEFVRQAEFARRMHAGEELTGVCSITFDDGSADNAELFPQLLPELGIAATVFVCPNLLGRQYPFLPAGAGVRIMTLDELRDLAGVAGVEIGAHTNDHTNLATADARMADEEMTACKTRVEELLGREVASFAYPGCRYSPACPDAARRAGYTSAVTCGLRGGPTPYELRRESPDRFDGRLTFELKLRGLFHPLKEAPPTRAALAVRRRLRRRSR